MEEFCQKHAVFWSSLVVHIGLGLLFFGGTIPPIIIHETFGRFSYALPPCFFILWSYSMLLHVLTHLVNPGLIPKSASTGAPDDKDGEDKVRGLLVSFAL